jgi:hypothetical protein
MKVLKQISVLLFSILLVFATGGIGLFQHYCSCSETLSQSVLVENIDCHDDHHCSVAIENKPISCCSAGSDETFQHDMMCDNDHHCCKTDYKFLKTDNTDYYTPNKKSFKSILALLKVSEILIEENETEPSYFQKINHDPPAAPFGRDLIISMRQLKIASPLA